MTKQDRATRERAVISRDAKQLSSEQNNIKHYITKIMPMRQYCAQINMMHNVLQNSEDVEKLVGYEKETQRKLV